MADCYGIIYRNNLNIKNSNNTNKIIGVISKINGISVNAMYRAYNEFMFRRKIIKYNCNNLIETFNNEKIYNEMNKYFNNFEFNKYFHALKCKHNKWNNGNDNNER